ncbi:hypothetical protein [Yinghuangia seranimata]|uniref:hypothetical protein n=1 Tax=Yinghuangia seranimata TaxID=408067 RepID=UPI00248C07F5|nr:hypothetical protein [Yinghuangia seranimata]MDI2130768.1 hypothetical protein [Yinghuangia seranimata]
MPYVRTSVVAPYSAYLRVYEPLAAFPEPERSHWADYVRDVHTRRVWGSGTTAELTAEEQRVALEGILATPPEPAPPHESEDAFVAEIDGIPVVCPRQTRLRCWSALAEMRREFPPVVLDAFWPKVVLAQAEADHDRWRSRNPDVQPHIHSSTWHVPMRWFVLFSQEERVLVAPAGDGAGGPGELYYRTPMVQARRRVARALRVLRDTLEEGALITGLEQLGRWLEEFHPRAMVELDFGGLVRLIPSGDLVEERTAEHVAEGLTALAAGDGARASEAYRRITERWSAVRALEHAS